MRTFDPLPRRAGGPQPETPVTLETLQESGSFLRHAHVFNALWMPDGSGVPKYKRFANTILDAMKGGIWALEIACPARRSSWSSRA